MNNDEKNKDLEALMNSMFRNHRLSTVSAEDYLEQTKKQDVHKSSEVQEAQKQQAELEVLQQRGKSVQSTLESTDQTVARLNAILARQTAEAQQQARDLGFTDQDLEKLQRQVRQDFGVDVNVENQQKRQAKDLQAVLNGMRETAQAAAETVYGQTDYLDELARAFFRPLALGQDEDQLRNVIVVSGPKGSGRHLGLKTIVELLAAQNWLSSPEILILNGSHYAGSEQEKVFLQDCYSISVSKAEVIVIENAEACYTPFLNQLFQLCQDLPLPLSKRYVLNKGQLVEASSALVSQAISTLTWKNKYVVFTGGKRETLMQNFPRSLSERIIDKPMTKPLESGVQLKIYRQKIGDCVQRAEIQLHIRLTIAEGALERRLDTFNPLLGAAAYEKDAEQLFAAISELCLKRGQAVQEITADASPQWKLTAGEETLAAADLIDAEQEDLDAIRQEMNEIVGLQEVKEVLLGMEQHYQVALRRQRQGMKAAPVSRHMIFTGNPGTGKTTMARLAARLFKALGLLSQGQLVEVSRSDLVGRYVGHTAPLTQQVIESALGGVLFIDEAYSLVRGKDDSFGLEAVDTLVKGMEDHRDDLIVILAGYSREMEEFLNANSGLKSRFPNILNFADYTGSELTQIALSLAKGKEYVIEESCLPDLTIYFNAVQMNTAQRSGNGRLARNTVEKAIMNQSRRILNQPEARMDLLQREDFDLNVQ